jgi:hypothetical protein
VVIQQRVVKEEALLTPMALLGVYLFLRWDAEAQRRERFIWLAAFVTGLSALAKVPGAFFLPPLVLLFFMRGGLRPALLACAGGVLGLLPLLLYGAYVDLDLFVFSTGTQAGGRPAHWNLFRASSRTASSTTTWLGTGTRSSCGSPTRWRSASWTHRGAPC